jgi:hypothetical protein
MSGLLSRARATPSAFRFQHRKQMQQQIIGFYSSAPSSGKSTAAMVLKSKGFHNIAFADPLKAMAYSLLVDLGYEAGKAFDFLHSNKYEVIEAIGVTGRHLMRTLGTEWGREMINQGLWVSAWKSRMSGFNKVVVEDVRRLNEAEAVKEKGGQIWRICRNLDNPDVDHASEGQLDDWNGFDLVIENNGTIAELRNSIVSAYVDNVLLAKEVVA